MATTSKDAHTRPADGLRALFKRWQKSSLDALEACSEILDTTSTLADDRLCEHQISAGEVQRIVEACRVFIAAEASSDFVLPTRFFEIKSLPGGRQRSWTRCTMT